jgi:hypothetical protein
MTCTENYLLKSCWLTLDKFQYKIHSHNVDSFVNRSSPIYMIEFKSTIQVFHKSTAFINTVLYN